MSINSFSAAASRYAASRQADFLLALEATPRERLIRFCDRFDERYPLLRNRVDGVPTSCATLPDFALRAHTFCSVTLFWATRRRDRLIRESQARRAPFLMAAE